MIVILPTFIKQEDSECKSVSSALEAINFNLAEHGIVLVQTPGLQIAQDQWISRFPALLYFRNGRSVRYPIQVSSAQVVLNWLTSERTICIPDHVLEVNGLMLAKLMRRNDNVVAFFYEKGKSLGSAGLVHGEMAAN